jgi:hypothetical protein
MSLPLPPGFFARTRRRLAVLAIVILLPGCVSPLLVPVTAGTAVAGGLLYRQRGGALDLGLGTQGARLVWAAPTGVLVAGLAGAWWLAPVVAGTAFAGQLLGHAAHQRSGAGLAREAAGYREETPLTGWLPAVFGPYDAGWPAWRKEVWHYAGSSTVAVMRAALIVGPALAVDPVLAWAIPAGLFPAYFVGWRTPSALPHLRQGSEVAEFLTGATLFLTLMLTAGVW